MSTPDRRARLDRDHGAVSIRRQCTLLSLARSGVYRMQQPANDEDVALVRAIDELFRKHPVSTAGRYSVGWILARAASSGPFVGDDLLEAFDATR